MSNNTTFFTIFFNDHPDTPPARDQVSVEPDLNYKNNNWVVFSNTRPNDARIRFTTSCPLESFDGSVPANSQSVPFKVDKQLKTGHFKFCVFFDGADGENDICPGVIHGKKAIHKAKKSKAAGQKHEAAKFKIFAAAGDDPQIIIGG